MDTVVTAINELTTEVKALRKDFQVKLNDGTTMSAFEYSADQMLALTDLLERIHLPQEHQSPEMPNGPKIDYP